MLKGHKCDCRPIFLLRVWHDFLGEKSNRLVMPSPQSQSQSQFQFQSQSQSWLPKQKYLGLTSHILVEFLVFGVHCVSFYVVVL